MSYAFHVTLRENVEKILSTGIQPRIGKLSSQFGEQKPAVYLFQTAVDLETALSNWLGDALEEHYGDDCEIAILQIDMSSISYKKGAEYELITEEYIPARFVIDVFDEENLMGQFNANTKSVSLSM